MFRIFNTSLTLHFWASPRHVMQPLSLRDDLLLLRTAQALKVYDPGFPRDEPDVPTGPDPSFPTDVPAPEPHDVPAPEPIDVPPPEPGDGETPGSKPPSRPGQNPKPRPVP